MNKKYLIIFLPVCGIRIVPVPCFCYKKGRGGLCPAEECDLRSKNHQQGRWTVYPGPRAGGPS